MQRGSSPVRARAGRRPRARFAVLAAAAAAAIACAAGARRAEASDPRTWRVPAECGGSARLVARVAAQAGRPLGDGDPISVDVAIAARVEGGFVADLELVSVRGAARRQVQGADCATVIDAVALVLAVAMHEAPPVLDVSRPVAAARAPARFLVGVAFGVDEGALPAAAPGAALVIALDRGPLRLEVGGEIYQSAFAPMPMDERRGADIGLLGVRARACRRVGPLRTCGGAAIGRLEGRPIGDLAERSTESRRWSALLAGLGWSYRFGGRFALGVDVDGLLAIDRPRFVVEADGDLIGVHQPAGGGVRVGAGLEVEIR